MKKYLALYLGFIGLFISISCSDSNDIQEPPQNNGVVLNNKINNFVWKGMNSWYNWLPESANLADSKDDDQDEYYTFLNMYSKPSDLMYNLCYKHHSIVGMENAVDRFSWFIEDYDVQNNAFQGIRTRFGFTSRLIQINEAGDIIISVLMVEPGSPADDANMQRGSIINAIYS